MSAGSTSFDIGRWLADTHRDENCGPVVKLPPKHAAPGRRWLSFRRPRHRKTQR